jgi:SAM-dependent methyltransferase
MKPRRDRLDAPAAFGSFGRRHRRVRLDDEVVIPRYFVVAEATHEIQNPTSEEKLLVLGRRLGLGPDSRVLDIASGRGGPALLLARAFGCSWHGIELSPDFHAVAMERVAEADLGDRVAFALADAASATHEAESYDVALCLGASFVYGSLADTVEALAPAVRPGGHVVVGEPYWRRLPLPDDYEDRDQPWTSLEGTVRIFETSGMPVVAVIASSEDDWDRYETLHWQAVERWLAANEDDPDAPEIRTRHEGAKWSYLRHERDHLGWAIFVGRKPL